MSVDNQEWFIKRGEDVALALNGVDNTNPSGWALKFTLVAFPGASTAVLDLTPVVSGPVSGVFVITTTLTRTQTLALLNPTTQGYSKTYYWDVWRTDTGSNVSLASGTLLVSAPARQAA